MCSRRGKLIVLLTFSAFGLFPSASVQATPDVHCTGDASAHGTGNLPQVELNDTGGGQCHGEPGDQGKCNVSYEGNKIGEVNCGTLNKPNGELHTCSAQINCSPNDARSCAVYNGGAFAGVLTIDGKDYAFVDCPTGSGMVLCPNNL